MDTLFPADRRLEITPETRPLTQTGSLAVYVQLAEDRLFVQGFDDNERVGRPPTLLRGALVLRVLKPTRIKSVSLTFTGHSRTEWPEGIPPKRSDFFEENVLVSHTWPFFTAGAGVSSGADLIKSPSNTLLPVLSNGSLTIPHEDVSSLSLDSLMGVSRSPVMASNPLALLKRVASPSPERSRRRSASVFSQESQTTTSNGEFVFQPGDYVYNFEHPVPASIPETIDATFGSVNYHLEVFIERYGAFKSNITTKLPVQIVRAQSDDSVEDSEPIAISRDWEDQLHYDIIIASKAMVLNAYIPIAFKLIPLDKIKLHRIRIYITENMEYYCRNKKVHRMQPAKKFLLLEHKAPPPPDLPPDADAKAKKMGNLLTSDGYDLTAKEFEFQVYVPEKLNAVQKLHPNTSYQNVKIHHWIKICLRLSRVIDGKPKHYEISIDSPIHILHQLCSHANTLLPAYGLQQVESLHQNHQSNIYFPMDVIGSPPQSPEVEAFDHTPHHSLYLALGRDDTSRGRARSNSALSHSLSNFESTLSANIYKPDNLDIELTSPQAVPLSPMLSPQPFALEDMTIPPPPFQSMAPFSSPSPPPMLKKISDTSHSSIGIDAIMDAGSPPLDPPDYEELMRKESGARIFEPEAPDITLTRASESPESNKGDPGDLGDDFEFTGTSSIMPEGVMRATSPERQRARAKERSAHTSPRVSLDLNRSDLTLSIGQHQNDIDALLHQESEDEEEEEEEEISEQRSRFSSRSSLSPSRPLDYDTELTDMQPLLHTTSTTSDSPFGPFSSRWESRESLARRESASVDITALYQSGIPSFSRTSIFEPSSAFSNGISARTPSFDASMSKRPSLDSRRGSAIAALPIMTALSGEQTIDEENESIKTKSEESSIRDNQSSHSTLTSANEEHGDAHKKETLIQMPSQQGHQQITQ